jgi:hypothetical protein
MIVITLRIQGKRGGCAGDVHQRARGRREIIFWFEGQSTGMHSEFWNNREKDKPLILVAFYWSYRVVLGDNKCNQIFLILSSLVVYQKELQKGICPEEEGWVVC